jgi:hypothetical protein
MLQFTFIRILPCYSSLLGQIIMGLNVFWGGLGFTNTVLGSSRAPVLPYGPRPTRGRTDAARRGTERERRDPPATTNQGPFQKATWIHKVNGPAMGPRSMGQQWVKDTGPARGPMTLGQQWAQGQWASEGPKDTGPARGPRTRGQRGAQGHGAIGPTTDWAIGPTGPLGPPRAVHAFARSRR